MRPIATLTMNPALDVTTATAHVAPTHKMRCGPARREPGGGGINVARVVATLGGDAVAVFPSGGPAGAAIEHALAAEDVPMRAVRIDGDTRESFTVDESATGEQFRFVLPGPMLTDADQAALLDALCGIAGPPGHVVVSGSLPPGVEPTIFARIGAWCRSIGARLILDTSGPALAGAMNAGVWLIKPSERELSELTGASFDDEAARVAAARTLIARGLAEHIVVSLGERGADLVTATTARHFPAIAVDVQSAVGAGDAMVGGLTLALARGASLDDAVAQGIAAGAAALMTPGTQLVRREDFESLMRRPR